MKKQAKADEEADVVEAAEEAKNETCKKQQRRG